MRSRSQGRASVALTAADLRYEPTEHRTYKPDGTRVPHVTRVLGSVGLSRDFEELGAISRRVSADIELACYRGTAVHADCHALDDNELDLADVDPRVLPFVRVWTQCRDDLALIPLAHGRERQVYHPIYDYTGILDGLFARAYIPANRGLRGPRADPLVRLLIDLKTGNPADAAGDLQTSAYEAAWNYAHPTEKIDERWAIWLQPSRKRVPYEIINYSAWPDAARHFPTFLAALTVYREQQRRFGRKENA